MIKDEQGKISLVFFHVLIDDVENNKYHEFKKLRVQKFMNELLIKSTEITIAWGIENVGIQVAENVVVTHR